MARFVLLDAGLIGLACANPRNPGVIDFNAWIASKMIPSVDLFVADISRFEVRRELIRIGAGARIGRLDQLCGRLGALPVTVEAWERAAEFWAIVRQAGRPTASPDALDADAILAGVAATMSRPGDEVVIATTNVRQLGWFPGIDAQQ